MTVQPNLQDTRSANWWAETLSSTIDSLRQKHATGRLGLRFTNAAVERDYRRWHLDTAAPFVRVGTIASIAAWLISGAVYAITQPARMAIAIPLIAGLLIPVLILSLATVSVLSLRRWMLPVAALANAMAGVLGIIINYRNPALPQVVMASTIVITYFGFTIYRFHTAIAAPTVLSYVALNEVLLLNAARTGEIDTTTATLYSLLPAIAYLTGLMVCGVLDAVTRQQYRQEQLIAAQNEALDHERERANGLLYSIFPDAIAERLKSQPGVIADFYDDATIVFADMVGFTPLVSTLTPEEMVALLSKVFETFDSIAARHGIEKIKTIGDAYMAVAGVPDRRPDHAAIAVRFALDVRAALDGINEESGAQLRLRIGLHSGPVIAGVIGREKLAYDLWGDAVNTAARMESHGLPGQIQLTDETRSHLGEAYKLRERGEIEVKGKGMMRVWLVDT